MPFINANGLGFHVQELNKGADKTVVMIHGMFSNLSVFYFNIAPILAETYNVILYDLKGHGFSEKATSDYDIESMADDLLCLIEALHIQRFHLVGYSFGSLVGLKIATRAPERLDKLVVIEGPDPNDLETWSLLTNYSKEMLIYFVNNATAGMRMGKRQLERQHRRYSFLCNETSLSNDMLKERDFFSNGGLETIRNATLLIYGKSSKCRASGSDLKDKIPNSSIIYLDGDHNIPLQQPEATALSIKNFLTDI